MLAEMFTLDQHTPAEFEALRTIGGGYGVSLQHISPPSGRQLSPESLAKVRRKRLEKRVKSKVPMFAEHFIEQEIEKKQGYYAGETDAKILQKQNDVLAGELERYQRLMEHVNEVFIYGEEPAECKERAARLQTEMAAIREQNEKMEQEQ